MPRGHSPLADNVPSEDISPFLDSVARACSARAESLPSHVEFVRRMVAGPNGAQI